MYIETPGLSYEWHPMKGFIAHLDYNLFSRNVDLQFAMFLEGCEQPNDPKQKTSPQSGS